jgi:DNA-binding NarL/FixJ family response regulator
MTATIAVALVEDLRTTREGLAALLTTSGFRLTGAFRSIEEAFAPLAAGCADVVLLDIGLPGASGIEGTRMLRDARPELAVLILTVYADEEHVFDAICAGAYGYLLKDTPPDRLLAAIREVVAGGAPMSPDIARKVIRSFQREPVAPAKGAALSGRETEVLTLLAAGHSYKTAASKLGLSLDTVRFHVRNIYDKLHVHSKSEAVARALRGRLLK